MWAEVLRQQLAFIAVFKEYEESYGYFWLKHILLLTTKRCGMAAWANCDVSLLQWLVCY